MSKRCPECLQTNEDSRIFCSYCGAALDADIRLIQDIEKLKAQPAKAQPTPRKVDDDDIDDIPRRTEPKKDFRVILWITLGLLAVAAVAAAAWFFLKNS